MRKTSIYFAASEKIPIFAPAILEKTGGNALFDILHDRLRNKIYKIISKKYRYQ